MHLLGRLRRVHREMGGTLMMSLIIEGVVRLYVSLASMECFIVEYICFLKYLIVGLLSVLMK
jgi:hypothetical protein